MVPVSGPELVEVRGGADFEDTVYRSFLLCGF